MKTKHGGKRKNQTGRPATIKADGHLNMRMEYTTMILLAGLMKKWNCSKSEAVRRAIQEASEPRK